MSHAPDVNDRKATHEEAPPSQPHHGHGGTSYEGLDARASLVIWSLAIIGGTLVIVFAITIFFQKIIQKNTPLGEPPSPLAPARVLAPAPQLQVHPWEELPEMRAHENEVLNSAGKDANGHYHVPIDQAMQMVVSRLKIEPNAPEGITTPGGNGRDFSKGLADMPAPYQRPAIQGEIEKHAK